MEQQASESAQEHALPNYRPTSSVDLRSPTEAPLGTAKDAVPNDLRTPNLGLRSTSLPNVKEHNLPTPSSSSFSHYQPRRHSTLDTATFPLPLCGPVETLSFAAANKSSSIVPQGFGTHITSREHDAMTGAATLSASATINDEKKVSNNTPQGFDVQSISKEQFPVKLHRMLELSEKQALGRGSGSISWLPDGRAFRILDEVLLMEYVVPIFFKQTKIRSFQRQLNLWGFKRVEAGRKNSGVWHHRSFLRGAPADIKKMIRVKIKRRSKDAREHEQKDDVPYFCSKSSPNFRFASRGSEDCPEAERAVSQGSSQAESLSRGINSLTPNHAILAASNSGSSASADKPALDEFANFIDGAIKML